MTTSRNAWVPLLAFLQATSAKAQFHEVIDLFEASDHVNISVRVKTAFNESEAAYEVELCPTDLCDVFELNGASNGEDLDVILDFVLIYTLYAHPYKQLGGEPTVDEETGERLFPPIDLVIAELDRGAGLLDKYGGGCTGSEAERALCVMRGLVVKHDMRFYFARYSGGVTYIAPSRTIVDRLNELTPQRIESFLRLTRRYRE